MRLANVDVLVDDEAGLAWTTGLEFPEAAPRGASLLSTQRWLLTDTDGADGAVGQWRLAQHRTIPYTADSDASACLRCDRRGCVALQRRGAAGAAGMPGDGRA